MNVENQLISREQEEKFIEGVKESEIEGDIFNINGDPKIIIKEKLSKLIEIQLIGHSYDWGNSYDRFMPQSYRIVIRLLIQFPYSICRMPLMTTANGEWWTIYGNYYNLVKRLMKKSGLDLEEVLIEPKKKAREMIKIMELMG